MRPSLEMYNILAALFIQHSWNGSPTHFAIPTFISYQNGDHYYAFLGDDYIQLPNLEKEQRDIIYYSDPDFMSILENFLEN